jgi:hypothetical protein
MLGPQLFARGGRGLDGRMVMVATNWPAPLEEPGRLSLHSLLRMHRSRGLGDLEQSK